MEAKKFREGSFPAPSEPQNDSLLVNLEDPPAHSARRLNPIRYAEELRFEIPAPQRYSVTGSMGSIMSLVVMSLVATIMLQQLASPGTASLWSGSAFTGSGGMPAWVLAPFLFTIIGSTLGWVFELGLLMAGIPFQQTYNRATVLVQKLRFLNLAPVTATIFFAVCAMVIPDPGLRTAALLVTGFGCCGLAVALFFGGASAVPLLLLATQAAQLAIVLASPTPLGGGLVVLFLALQAILQFTALMIGATTPAKSTAFHLISTLSGMMLFAAIMRASSANPDFAQQLAPTLPTDSLLFWGLVASCLAGLAFAMKASPMTWNNFRSGLSNGVWSAMYFKLVSAKRFPEPVNLSAVYEHTPPTQTRLRPYYQAHPEYLPESLSIPAIDDSNIERNVKTFKQLVKEALAGFKLIAALDHQLPQADVRAPLKYKPRLPVWSNGADFWPRLFQRKLCGFTMPHKGILEQTPAPALDAFKRGQLLAYLTEHGVANTFARPAPERGTGALVADFSYLEQYATKPDYEPYGGKAFFRVNSERRCLELVSVVAPRTDREILANPDDPSFRRAEQLVLASLYFAVISGKHLAQIHMTFNLIEVSMHNAFDVQGQWKHPFRTFMYLHFFSHELAEEITTEHLIQEGAVFNQIFATTHEGLIDHLNDTYANFEIGVDEDFDARSQAMRMADGQLLPGACVQWELTYFDLWLRYATDLVEIIYPDDEAVRSDQYLQDFHQGLLQVLLKGLPARYEGFQTRQGVARFAADTIHHCVVRHQVYGTTGIRAALDPRISSTQVPRDTGTPGVDEWRSLAYVALATGEARFTLLSGPEGKDYTYLLEGVDERYAQPMAEVFRRLQTELRELDRRWSSSGEEQSFNYDYFRPLPSELRTGPGY